MSNVPEHSRKKVCYYYDADIGLYVYGPGHPMKPHRIRMTHNLVLNYSLYRHMHVLKPCKLDAKEMTTFHSDDYINVLQNMIHGDDRSYAKERELYNIGMECPAFEGMFEFSQICAGGSVQGAAQLNKNNYDIAINWSGGLHHAKAAMASGFCYVNDVVLAILELLKVHRRVLYIDIDIHHGDGVEEAFYATDRVMTVSFHQYGDGFFPATGVASEIGVSKGKYYTVNVPLNIGIDDESFGRIFKPVVGKVIEMYGPGAIVLQCGADSLAGDRLGSFNLTVHGHGKCVRFVKKYGIPLLLLGGGGYKLPTVARTWTYETAVALSKENDISDYLPYNDFYEYYGPEFKLQIPPTNILNQNPREYLDALTASVFENLRMLPYSPSVQFQPIPKEAVTVQDSRRDTLSGNFEEARRMNPYSRVVQDNELSDSEDEGDGRRDETNYKAEFKTILTELKICIPDNQFNETITPFEQDTTYEAIANPTVDYSTYSATNHRHPVVDSYGGVIDLTVNPESYGASTMHVDEAANVDIRINMKKTTIKYATTSVTLDDFSTLTEETTKEVIEPNIEETRNTDKHLNLKSKDPADGDFSLTVEKTKLSINKNSQDFLSDTDVLVINDLSEDEECLDLKINSDTKQGTDDQKTNKDYAENLKFHCTTQDDEPQLKRYGINEVPNKDGVSGPALQTTLVNGIDVPMEQTRVENSTTGNGNDNDHINSEGQMPRKLSYIQGLRLEDISDSE